MAKFGQARMAATPWQRFRHYAGWRIVGTMLAVLAVYECWKGNYPSGLFAAMFAVSYLFLIPSIVVQGFRTGYATGVSDTLTFIATGDSVHMRPDVHPADVAEEVRRGARGQ